MMNRNTLLKAAVILGLLGHVVPRNLGENVVSVQGNIPEKELDSKEQGRVQTRLSNQYHPKVMMGWPTPEPITGS